MAAQGLDRAVPPDPAIAKRMLEQIHGRWWNVYIGGPEATHRWTAADLAGYVRVGIERFMLTYVGRQTGGPLTRAQGKTDGEEAVRIARALGYTGAVPLCLDVEIGTYNSAPAKAVEYARGWCAAVRAAGARPGMYANPVPLQGMAKGKVAADFVWVASWVGHSAAKHDPHDIASFPDDLWAEPGQRAWQYAGAYGGKPCRVLGLDVDISVSDLGCLAGAPGAAAGTRPASAPAILRRGDSGARVARLTRKLSFVRSRKTGEAYLDGERERFDVATERALKAFQREHELGDDGRFGELSARKLRAAVTREQQRHAGARPAHDEKPPADDTTGPAHDTTAPAHDTTPPAHAPARGGHRPAGAGAGVAGLAERAARADSASDAAFDDLVEHGLALRRRIAQLHERRAHTTAGLLEEIVTILRRIEHDVEELGTEEERQPVATAAKQAAATATATIKEMAPLPASPSEGPRPSSAGGGNGAAAAPPAGDLGGMSDGDLVRLVHAHEGIVDAARGALVERFTRYEREVAQLAPPREQQRHAPPPPGKDKAKGGDAGEHERPRDPGGTGTGTRKGRQRPGGKREADEPEDAGKGESVASIRLGAEGWLVRGSKLALARYIGKKGNAEHAKLRRALRREAHTRKGGAIATRTWQRGVRAAQHLAGRPVTGVLDPELQLLLRPFWPADNGLRRAIRSTPAWRMIPGQVSPNFNLREFGCHDGTPYVTGLVREQHLTKSQAEARARELAKRLERVRRAGGDRPLRLNSVYRTIAHNASIPGSATNSSHLRGFAADIMPPAGVPIAVHHNHVRAAFEAGCGYYPPPMGNFCHGDFDRGLGLGRNWVGP